MSVISDCISVQMVFCHDPFYPLKRHPVPQQKRKQPFQKDRALLNVKAVVVKRGRQWSSLRSFISTLSVSRTTHLVVSTAVAAFQ